mmetsp:Transcript_21873/g.66396  ORF Transcript_21873/g.66396 Transcript_21873/m.66396 type:complete len:90 (-) Transcript_21873:1427-1696(-)
MQGAQTAIYQLAAKPEAKFTAGATKRERSLWRHNTNVEISHCNTAAEREAHIMCRCSCSDVGRRLLRAHASRSTRSGARLDPIVTWAGG